MAQTVYQLQDTCCGRPVTFTLCKPWHAGAAHGLHLGQVRAQHVHRGRPRVGRAGATQAVARVVEPPGNQERVAQLAPCARDRVLVSVPGACA